MNDQESNGSTQRTLSRIVKSRTSRMTVLGKTGVGIYQMEGWIEMSGKTVTMVNLTATRQANFEGEFPRTIHFNAAGSFENVVPVEVRYASQGPDVVIFDPPVEGHSPATFHPPITDLTFAFNDDIAIVSGTMPECDDEDAPQVTVYCDMKTVKGKVCGEICLNFLVRQKKNGDPVISVADLQKSVDRMNQIWGCGADNKKGPCCIKFKFDHDKGFQKVILDEVLKIPPGHAGMPNMDDLTFRKDFNRLFGHGASTKCWNIALIDQLESPGNSVIGGTIPQTEQAADKRGTVVGVNNPDGSGSFSTSDLGEIMAHELGHAIGVADDAGTDADGVKAHSTNVKNLMAAQKNGVDLNQKQCDKARQSEWVRATDDACACAPDET